MRECGEGGDGVECACGEKRVVLCSPIISRVFDSGPDPSSCVECGHMGLCKVGGGEG